MSMACSKFFKVSSQTHSLRLYSAGITDSPLTNHGVLQANRLGQHLAAIGVQASHIFSSDLVRAFKTAEAIRLAQPIGNEGVIALETQKLEVLREQDFGFYEGKTFYERSKDSNKTGKDLHHKAHKNDPGFKDVESKESMRARSDTFIDEHLLHLFGATETDHAVVVVAHGIILAHLWRCILRRFSAASVSVAPGVIDVSRALSLEYLGGWSNTGYLELEINQKACEVVENSAAPDSPQAEETSGSGPQSDPNNLEKPKLLTMSLAVKAVNSLDHLKGLKKTRGGIGSSKHDEAQKTIETFFKKRKIG
jgi:broad specificity phosphatase PhoE